ncbi:MauE/DoxX family redox-associated membrane protein [Nocardia mexicana]|uniref:Methylamine utilisation protein MauE domain-containing protein n=1 Tax=Nocardia mexicana TaxID=279262 RepID=A0A370HAJ6_9NOCA|nr:MauE/DoxX family redox-associated membrane protein [Nocardia mexicana]RDI53250.1 hypothetical protein DFR68_103638 [Nocardia mexicana]
MVSPVSLSAPAWAVCEVAVRLVVGGLLFARGVGLLNSASARRQLWLALHQLVPAPLVRPVALSLPVAELLAGILLLLGAFGTFALVTAAVVLVSTTVAGRVALGRGLVVAGGSLCRLQPLLSRYTLLRNMVFVGAIGAVAVHGGATPAVTPWHPWAQAAAVAAVTGTIGTIIAILRRAQRRRLLSGIATA